MDKRNNLESLGETWWFICTVCHRAYAAQTQLTHLFDHKKNVHRSKGAADILILNQEVDLNPTIKIVPCNHTQPESQNQKSYPTRIENKPKGSLSSSKEHLCENCSISFPTLTKLKKHLLLVHTPAPNSEASVLAPDGNNYGGVAIQVSLKREIEAKPEAQVHDGDEIERVNMPDDQDRYDSEWEPDGSESDSEIEVKEEDRFRRTSISRLGNGRANPSGRCDPTSPTSASIQHSLFKSDATKLRRAKFAQKCASRPIYPCPVCEQVFHIRLVMVKHANESHQSKEDRTCKLCRKICVSWQALRIHKREMHSKPYVDMCSTCGKMYRSRRTLNAHVKTCGSDKSRWKFMCDICNKACPNPGALKGHKLSHDQPELGCPSCGKLFKTKVTLKRHQARHFDERPFKCNKCGSAFKLKDHLWKHQKQVHFEGPQVSCDKCSRMFNTRRKLQNHTKRVHETLLICRVCGQQFSGRTSLIRHEVDAHDYRRLKTTYKCQHCSKVFLTNEFLKIHVAIHENRASFVCDTCGKAFKSKTNLFQHRISHLSYEEFKHSCNLCGKRFGLPHHVRQHKKSAHRNEPTENVKI